MADLSIWRYRATLRRVVDADTLSLVADLGFRMQLVDLRVRLLGLNAPERATPAGQAATAYAIQWLQAALTPQTPWELLIETEKGDEPDKFGARWLARVYRVSDGRALGDDLIAAGHAVAWDGTGPKPVP
jgi:micrococcal nuclease